MARFADSAARRPTNYEKSSRHLLERTAGCFGGSYAVVCSRGAACGQGGASDHGHSTEIRCGPDDRPRGVAARRQAGGGQVFCALVLGVPHALAQHVVAAQFQGGYVIGHISVGRGVTWGVLRVTPSSWVHMAYVTSSLLTC